MSFSLHVPVPAIRGHFGRESLWTFQTQVRPDQLVNLLGHDPRHDNWKRLPADLQALYGKIQRKTSKSRRDSVEGYLEDRLIDSIIPGAFPSICIGMTRPPIFEEGSVISDQGVLKMDLSPENTRILLDGLGRVSGSLAFLDDNRNEKDLFTLPTTIFAPHERHRELTLDQLGQLFFDFNFRASPISRSHALELDQSDLYLLLTNTLGKSEFIVNHGGMETRRQSLGSKSTAIVVQSVLLRFVRGACEGGKFQKSNNATVENPNLTRVSFTDTYERIAAFLETFEHQMGGKRFSDRQSLHLTSVGWQALGLTAHDLLFELPHLDAIDRGRLAKEMAAIDWSRSNKDMLEIGVLSEVNGDIGLSGRGVAAVEALHNYIRKQTSLREMISAVEPASEIVETTTLG
jgi:DNA-sulfur modification-associated